ncbi:MAG: hypothetical protein HC824_02855 [Synechococcales cyanobacterium RM1_1_8]|nr:hypothetical protein [Synechococcales cyanobacterium RM1_1_8]
MSTQAITRSWKTHDITVMSNVTSVHVQGKQVTKLGMIAEENSAPEAEIHLALDVQNDQHIASLLAETKTLGVILKPKDALELGLLLTAMGLENANPEKISTLFERLSQMMADFSIEGVTAKSNPA